MIKRTEVSKQKTPKTLNGKQSYSNKGTHALKKSKSFEASTKATPGMGKGKARGMGAAEFGGKFSGVY
jgi:hypothetical protein|tara:strand:- start:1637 stop:1840 length:204 start_codon:yes stop_codon:yes gene_type:complete